MILSYLLFLSSSFLRRLVLIIVDKCEEKTSLDADGDQLYTAAVWYNNRLKRLIALPP
jgi:hypothetical protein